MRTFWTTIAVVVLAVVGVLAESIGVAAEEPADLSAVRKRYESMTKTHVVTAGYAPDVACVGTPAGMMGWHAEKYPFNEDNLIDAWNPEILLLDENGIVMGLEYETYDVGVPRPSLFGYAFERTEGHQGKEWPHYALHIHFLPDGGHFIGDFNPGRRCPTPPFARQTATASVVLRDANGSTVGRGVLNEDPTGYVQFDVELSSMRPGAHGFHIHAVGTCEGPAFTSAGGHFNPLGRQHGVRNPLGSHAGDLPSAINHGDGKAHLRSATTTFTLSAGPRSLFDADGSAVVVHLDDDNHVSDPTGNAGARVACGVIEQAAGGGISMPSMLPRTGQPLMSMASWGVLVSLAIGAAGVAIRRLRP